MKSSDATALYGTTQPRPEVRRLAAGPLSLELENGAIRYVRHSGFEAIRGIDYLVRDSSWRTPPAALTMRSLDEGQDAFEAVLDGEVRQDEIHYRYTLTVSGKSDGTLEVVAEAEALSTFMTNRTGFVVLHPIKGVAGRPVTVTHKDGSTSETTFPELISPGQPIFDIRALRHEVADGLFVTCRMEAAFPHDPETVYEMEDQRNWTDASYKTYVCSLLDPWPYEIAKGAKVRQRIALSFEGTAPAAGDDAAGPATLTFGEGTHGRMPAVGLGLMPAYREGAGAAGNTLARLKPRFFTAYAEADAADCAATLGDYAALAKTLGAEVQLELILPQGRPPAEVLDEVAAACKAAGLAPARVLACPAPYLKSIQPVGPWPDVSDLGHVMNQVRRAFPDAVVVGGMASYFTELNRKRPPVATIDAVSCTTTPIVHAADDRSVMETHEALPAVILSMAAMAPGKSLHLGPSAIAMRHNPYGAATAANPDHERIAMAEDDPRQKGLFAAAWSVGYAAAVAKSGGVSTLALNHLAGPSGVLDDGAKVRPVFHVMADLCRASGAELSDLDLTGDQLAGLAWLEGGKKRLLVANLTAEPARLAVEGTLDGKLLDATTVAAAAHPAWRDSGSTALGPTIELGAYAVLFAAS
jgi:D-apionolactonase